jgi:hypothetical protein
VAVCTHHVPAILVQRPALDVEAVGAHQHALEAALVIALCTGGLAGLYRGGTAGRLRQGQAGAGGLQHLEG